MPKPSSVRSAVSTRQPFASLFTIAVIGIALALPVSLQLFVVNARAATGSWRNAVDVTVYFKGNVVLPKVEQLAKNLRLRAGVSAVTVVPADKGLAEFRKFSGFGAALDALTENPLPHVMVVSPAARSCRAGRYRQPARVSRQLAGS